MQSACGKHARQYRDECVEEGRGEEKADILLVCLCFKSMLGFWFRQQEGLGASTMIYEFFFI